jgi:hypothetical protein
MFFIPGILVSALTFPGVVIHELAHQMFCRYFNVPVYEVCYFHFGNPTGYVIHGQPEKWTHSVLIAAGPFFMNSILGVVLTFPSVLRVSEFDGATSVFDGILLWLGISIAMHAIPSIGDAKSMWQAVSGNKAPLLAKLIVAPIVGIIFLLAVGSVFWLDLAFGVGVILGVPKIYMEILVARFS